MPRAAAAAFFALAGAAAVVLVAVSRGGWGRSEADSTALMGTWTKAHGIGIDKEPYSAPANLWMYWGPMTNKRFTSSGEHVRHVFKMGNIAGGEWRDPKFLRSLEGGLFNKLSGLCCTALLFPPIEWDFLVVNPQKIVGQNIRGYVANGNTMIFTGGIMSLEFINRYFYYNLEQADGNLDPGPFIRLPTFHGLTEEQHKVITDGTPSTQPSPKTLPQVGIEVTPIKKESLPSGASIIYTSPYNAAVVAIKFCEAENPMNDPAAPLPPVKVLPRDCPRAAAEGRPCSCGFVCYLGYDWRDAYPSRWDYALKTMVDVCSMVPPENSSPELLRQLHNDPEPSAEEELQKEEDLEASQNAAGASPTEEAKAAPAEADEESGENGAAAAEKDETLKEELVSEVKKDLKEELVSEVSKQMKAASGAAEHDGGVVEASAAGARAAAAPAAQEVGDEDAPPADETEGLEAFADETDCGPLCKLERLVDKLSK